MLVKGHVGALSLMLVGATEMFQCFKTRKETQSNVYLLLWVILFCLKHQAPFMHETAGASFKPTDSFMLV